MSLILGIDDMSMERCRLRQLVEREGHDFIDAANGLEALALIGERRPDCILSDLMMPEMDGFALLAVLQERGNRIPVIVLTADRQESTRAECERLGAVAVLHKSWDPQALAALLREQLAMPSGTAGGAWPTRARQYRSPF